MTKIRLKGRLYYILFRSDSEFFKKYSTVRSDNLDTALYLALKKYNHLNVFNVITEKEFKNRAYLFMGFTFKEDIS